MSEDNAQPKNNEPPAPPSGAPPLRDPARYPPQPAPWPEHLPKPG